MPIVPRPTPSPWLQRAQQFIPQPVRGYLEETGRDPASFVTPVGMAAREPASFLARKLAAFLQRKEQLGEELGGALRDMGYFGEDVLESIARKMRPGSYLRNFFAKHQEAQELLLRLRNTERAKYSSEINRAKDALDLWRLRNLPVGETVRRSAGVKDLWDWYLQGLKGPF